MAREPRPATREGPCPRRMASAIRRGSQNVGHNPAHRPRRRKSRRRLPPHASLLRQRQSVVAPRGRREPRRRRAARVRVRRGVRRAQEPGGHEPARRRNVRRQDRREDPTSMYASRELRARRVGDAAVDAHVGRDDRHRGRPARRGGADLGADGAQGDGPVGVGRRRRWVAVGERDSPGRRRRERDEDSGGCD